MTTNVIDLLTGTAASDSRWSVAGKGFLIFFDDAGFEKILPLSKTVCVFSGHGGLIQEWKNWLSSKPAGHAGHPPVTITTDRGPQSVTINIVIRKTRQVRFTRGQCYRHSNEAVFAGTGTYQALLCWTTLERDAKMAVEYATTTDPFSGGPVKSIAFDSETHSLRDKSTIQDVDKLIGTKGTVMYTTFRKEVPVAEAAANDANVMEVVRGLDSGNVVASAPCVSMHEEWTPEEITELECALDDILALEGS